MYRFRHGVIAPALGGLMLTFAGCAVTSASLTTAVMPAAPAAHDELPKDKQLQTTLTFARNLDKSGNDDGAVEQYEKVLRLSPDHPESLRRLAVLYDRRADFTNSEAAYKKLARSHSRDADFMCDWGYSLYLRNNWREAEAKLRRALEIDKSHARARCNLGLVLGQQDRFDEAFTLFRQAGLEEADAHCDLAFVYWTRGKGYYDRARRECVLARQLNPACSKAQELLAQLDQAQSPRSSRLASNTPAAPPQQARASMTSEERHEKYPLPPGWARMPMKANSAEAPATGAAAPVAPASPTVTQGTVTFD
jgi:tetratricopeptide (TPR) repeat protein